MKGKSAKQGKLQAKTVEDLEAIKDKLSTIDNSEELIKALYEINEFGKKTIEEYIPSGSIDLVNSLQEEIVELYDAIAKIVDKPSFSEFSAFKNFISSMKEAWLRTVESSREEIAEIYRKNAYKSQENENYQESLACFNKVLEIKPKDPRNWFERGNVFFDMGDYISAIRDYEMVLQFDSGNPNALCNIGLSLHNLYKFDESLEYFERALRIDPNYAVALVGMGNSYFRLGRFNEARRQLEEALRLYPDYVDANLAMGSLMHDGFYEENKARAHAEKVLRLDPDNIVAKANLAEVLLAFGKDEYERSATYASEVLERGIAHLGYPMRLMIVCSLYFRNHFDEAAKASLDLVKYYETVHDTIVIIWKFLGLRRTIARKDISADVQSLLYKFIDLAEEPDVYAKNRLLKELPEIIISIDSTGRFARTAIQPGKEQKPMHEQEIMVKNTSRPDRLIKGYYDWEVFLTPADALREVEKVVYTLHETFPNRFREVRDRETGFRLKSKGWGEFQVKVAIYFMNREEPMVKYHWLRLGQKGAR